MLAADSRLARRITATVQQRKLLQTQTYTSQDTSRQGRYDGEPVRTIGGLFVQKAEVISTTEMPHRISSTARPGHFYRLERTKEPLN